MGAKRRKPKPSALQREIAKKLRVLAGRVETMEMEVQLFASGEFAEDPANRDTVRFLGVRREEWRLVITHSKPLRDVPEELMKLV